MAWVIDYYGAGVWANCAWPVVVRGFYALNDYRTPVRVGVWVVGLNLVLNLTLIWPLAEAGLALSTTVATVVQLFILMAIFSRRQAPLDWRALAATAARAILATVGDGRRRVTSSFPTCRAAIRLLSQVIHVGVPIFLGAATYCGAYLLLGGRELGMLWSGRVDD